MTFLSPFLLWFLAAASVPVIIHLLNKRRHKTVQWAAMQFLLKATRESRGKKKLRHILILTCRALAIAALAFAAARPIASGLLGWGAGTIDHVVLILDRSASMELRSENDRPPRREFILGKIRDAMSDVGNPRLILIDSASGKPREITSTDVLTSISTTTATDTRADIPQLLITAAETLAGIGGRSEIWLASDLQSSSWKPDDDRWVAATAAIAALPQPPAVRVLSVSGGSVSNVALRLLGTRRAPDGVHLDLELARTQESRGALSLPVTIAGDGMSITHPVSLPDQSIRFQKIIPVPDETSIGHGIVSIPPDGNTRDNIAYFAYGPARAIETIIVSPAGESADYLALASAPPGFEKQSSRIIDPAAFQTTDLSAASLMIWAAPLPVEKSAAVLTEYLTSGGQLLIVPPNDDPSGEFLGMKWSAIDSSPSGKFFIIKDWNRTDGPLRDGIQGAPIPAERLRAIKRAIPQGDSASLARWDDDEPFLTRKIIDRGTLWFLGSLPDYTWSNLGDADVLLPVVQRILNLGAARFDSSYLAEVGDPIPGAELEFIRVDGTSSTSSPYEAGVFQIGGKTIALNRPTVEDDPEIVSPEELSSILEGTGFTLLGQSNSSNSDLSTDLWRPFLFAVIFFLIAEALLCLPKISSGRTPVGKPTAPLA